MSSAVPVWTTASVAHDGDPVAEAHRLVVEVVGDEAAMVFLSFF